MKLLWSHAYKNNSLPTIILRYLYFIHALVVAKYQIVKFNS